MIASDGLIVNIVCDFINIILTYFVIEMGIGEATIFLKILVISFKKNNLFYLINL